MPIQVICPGCKKGFSISEKFAGKKGPCPKCKTIIEIPAEGEEILVHAPEQFVTGGRGVAGKLLTKPIARKQTTFSPVAAAAIGGAALAVFVATWVLGRAESFQDNLLLCAIGLLLVSPPIVVAGYAFLHEEEELEPHRGIRLYFRAGICAVIYAGLWWGFGFMASEFFTGDLWEWMLVIPFLVVGAVAALACLDMDFGSGFLHYCFYLLLTILLRAVGGMGWVWQIPNDSMG